MEILEGKRRGGVVYYQDGYLYIKDKVHSNSTIFLKCRDKNCSARAKIVTDILIRTSEHNHGHQDDIREKLLLTSRLKEAAENELTGIREIFDRETNNEPMGESLNFKSLSTTLYRRRNMKKKGKNEENLSDPSSFFNEASKGKRPYSKRRKMSVDAGSKEIPPQADDVSEETTDDQLMRDSCTSLLKFLFGDENWSRCLDMKQRSQSPNLQVFLSWMLDVVEQQFVMDEYFCTQQVMSGEDKPPTASEHQLGDHTVELPPHSTSIVFPTPIVSSQAETDEINVDPQLVISHEWGCGSSSKLDTVIVVQQRDGQFVCEACRLPIADVSILQSHVSLKHPIAVTNIICFCCLKTFFSVDSLINYHKTIQPSTDRVKSKLLDRQIDVPAITQFPCPVCHLHFYDTDTLRDHEKICVGPL